MAKLKKCGFIIIAALALLLSACSASNTGSLSKENQDTSAYKKITADEANKIIAGSDSVIIADVRRQDEYEAGHIPGAVNIPNEDISDKQPEELPDLDTPIIVYCRTGVRSKEAAQKLIDIGYTDVSDMGGIADWPYETVSGSEPGERITGEEGSAEEKASESGDENQGGLMSSFETTDTNGNKVDQSIFSDYDLTMVNVWTTYCGYCLEEMPDLAEVNKEYADKGVRVVGLVSDVIDMDGSLNSGQLELANEIIEKTGANYLHIVPSDDLMGILYQISSVPATFFVDSSGNQVGYLYTGPNDKDGWSDIIDELLLEVKK
ncbi:redoxin family protein [Lachnospiraceae bacterium NSJ-143]|nr:redoxin family protein [Lachnospiraceae bacterium NSJ-143]